MASAAEIQDLIEKMHWERSRLLALVRSLDEAEADRVPIGKTGEAEWTVKEQLAHLCISERNYAAWTRAAIERANPDVGELHLPPPAIPLDRAIEHSLAELLAEMDGRRSDSLALVQGLRPEDFERVATQPQFGTLTVLQWVRSFYRHDRMHFDQISGRESEYRPRFLDGEPDQRVRAASKAPED